jgi:enoyl-CoA hydratase/carnithine racemase
VPDFQHITYEVADRIATVTLRRPDQLNAFTPRMCGELLEVFDVIDADDDVRAVIVTGSGRAFCAGADLSSGGATFDADVQGHAAGSPEAKAADRAVPRDGGGLVTLRIFDCTKPVIAAINGPAVGVGITMTLPMDIRLAADDARMGFVFARRGITLEATSSWFLPRLVGISQAAEWAYTGRVFPATEALEGGLVRSLHPKDELLAVARGLAGEIVANTSAVSVALNRQMLWRMQGANHPMEAHRADSRAIYEMGRSADAVEGVTSFLEKRPPAFSLKVSEDLPDLFPEWDPPSFR